MRGHPRQAGARAAALRGVHPSGLRGIPER